MKNSQGSIPAFIEAHYYPGGLKYYHVSLTVDRPSWAPPSGDAGFSDEDNIAINKADLVIEFKRKMFLDKPLTWCGVYTRSGDETVGERRQHAGVGLWLSEYHITDFRHIIECLRTLLTLVANGFEQVRFEEASAMFLRDLLPKSVHAASDYPDYLEGIPFTQSTSSSRFVTDCSMADFEGMVRDAADHLAYLSFGYNVGTCSRALIHVPAAAEPPTSTGKIQIIAGHDNKLSKIISSIPKASGNVVSKVASLQSELKGVQIRNAELQAELVQKISEIKEKDTQAAALQKEVDASVHSGVSLPIMRQLNLLEQKILSEFQNLAGNLSRPQTTQHYPSQGNRGLPSPHITRQQNKGAGHPSIQQQHAKISNDANLSWPFVALIVSAIASVLVVAVWLVFFPDLSFF